MPVCPGGSLAYCAGYDFGYHDGYDAGEESRIAHNK